MSGGARGYCGMHYLRVKKHGDPAIVLAAGRRVQDLEARFWAKVDKDGPVPAHRPELGPCWVWTGSRDPKGYGSFRVGGRAGKTVKAHRQAYELLVGPIPEGLVLDHLCRNRPCVRAPRHLDPVIDQENWRRGDAPSALSVRLNVCKRGHPLAGHNLMIAGGQRNCRECWNARRRSYRARRREREAIQSA